MAPKLGEELRAHLIKAGRHSTEELTPFTAVEMEAVEATFLERGGGSRVATTVADLIASEIDFSNTSIGRLSAAGLIFSNPRFVCATFSGTAEFDGATFSGQADFKGATFSEHAIFEGAIFSGGWGAFFEGATFGQAHFGGATFSEWANFEGAIFSGWADFEGAIFSGAGFKGATFSGQADFEGATFSGEARFGGAIFSGRAIFGGATFSEQAIFEGATFFEWATFGGATFSEQAIFEGATFKSEGYFINAEMKGETTFRSATFGSEPPRFFGAKLHEGTVWRDVTWPEPPKDADAAGRFVDAYERLKLEMDRLKKHEDELDFFARELQCRRVLQGIWRDLPIALYGVLCNYGRSYVRPLLILLATVIVGAIPFWAYFGGFSFASFANTFAVLGIRKDLVDPVIIQTLPGWLKVIATVQTGLGIVLLFLFSLALRNRFRMK